MMMMLIAKMGKIKPFESKVLNCDDKADCQYGEDKAI